MGISYTCALWENENMAHVAWEALAVAVVATYVVTALLWR